LTNQPQLWNGKGSEAIIGFVCGYSRANRERKRILVLNAYVDESSAQSGSREYCLAGYMTTAAEWMKFSDLWDDALHEFPSIESFHAVEAQGRKGEFLGMGESERDQKVYRLAQVIDSFPALLSFDCRMSEEAFERILKPVCPYDIRDPYFILFHSIMITAARQLEPFGVDIPIDFVFDEKGRIGAEALLWYGPMRAMQPLHLRKLLGNRPVFKTDEELIPLQAADCLAWHLRRSREEQFAHENRPALPLLRKSLHVENELSEQYLADLADGFSHYVPENDRLRRGASIVQAMKAFEGYVMKRPREEQESEYEKFNDAMGSILKADPVKIRAQMEAEKKDREAKRAEKRYGEK